MMVWCVARRVSVWMDDEMMNGRVCGVGDASRGTAGSGV